MNPISRRQLLTGSLAGLTGVVAAPCLKSLPAIGPDTPPDARPGKLSFGLVTYQWGKDWDLPRLIENCQTARVEGVELRTTHAHGVEPSLGMGSRLEVRQRFRDSSVALAGLGSDERFDHPDPERYPFRN